MIARLTPEGRQIIRFGVQINVARSLDDVEIFLTSSISNISLNTLKPGDIAVLIPLGQGLALFSIHALLLLTCHPVP